MKMKLDRWDTLLGFLIVFVNAGAKIITGAVLSLQNGLYEANPLMQSPKEVLATFLLLVLAIVALFTLKDPYRKLGLATVLGVVNADFVHDTMVVLGFGAYETFAVSVALALLPLFATAFILLYQQDPDREEMKKRRNWKMFNV